MTADAPSFTPPSRERGLLFLALGLGFLGGILGAQVTGFPGREQGRAPSTGTVNAPVGDVPTVVERASPAVVAIVVSKEIPTLEEVPLSPLDDFFGRGPTLRLRRPTGETERRDIGGGSGFVVDADGLILTNRHVVSDTEAEYDVVFTSGERVRARVVAHDPLFDLAILRVDKRGLPTIELGDSKSLRVGQAVIAIGNALGEFSNSVSVGVISGIGRQIRAGDQTTGEVEVLDQVLQTDAAINPGNSGGPLLDLAGKAVGVNVAVAGDAENIGFAIPIDEAVRALQDFRKEGRVVRPALGVRYVLITPQIQSELKLPAGEGALVIAGEGQNEPAVIPGSAAANAGINEGDVILEVNGEPITQKQPLQLLIQKHRPGDTVTLTVLSNGERKTVRVTLEEAKS